MKHHGAYNVSNPFSWKKTIYTRLILWLLIHHFGQEGIDAYMAQCSIKSLGKSLSFDTVMEPDQDPEDEETQQDFETFKAWLEAVDKTEKAVEQAPPFIEPKAEVESKPKSSGILAVAKCAGCKLPEKKCILI